MLFAHAEEVVIDHEDELLGRAVPLLYDIRDAAPPDGGSVERGYGAVLAAYRTAARGLDRRAVVTSVDGLQRLVGPPQTPISKYIGISIASQNT